MSSHTSRWVMQVNRVFALVSLSAIALGGYVLYQVRTSGGPTEDLLEAIERGDHQAAERAANAGANANAILLGRPLIFYAIRNGKVDSVELLVRHGADVNARSAFGRSPLHEAALYGHKEIAEALLGAGANVNARNPRGETPLFYAEDGLIIGPPRTKRHEDVATILRQHGGIK